MAAVTAALALVQASGMPKAAPVSGLLPTPASVARANLTLHKLNSAAADGYDPQPVLDTIDFHFNPKELSFSKSAKWARPPAKDASSAASPEYQGAEPTKLSLEIFLDVSRSKTDSVVDTVERLLTCCVPVEGSKPPRPPVVILHWGQIQSIAFLVTQISAKYSRFSPDGAPIRATCNLSMEEMPKNTSVGTNPTSGAIGVRGQHVFSEGDSLTSLAYREYQDPAMWRAIADANDIDDPFRVRTGTTLLLPRADELKAFRS